MFGVDRHLSEGKCSACGRWVDVDLRSAAHHCPHCGRVLPDAGALDWTTQIHTVVPTRIITKKGWTE